MSEMENMKREFAKALAAIHEAVQSGALDPDDEVSLVVTLGSRDGEDIDLKIRFRAGAIDAEELGKIDTSEDFENSMELVRLLERVLHTDILP